MLDVDDACHILTVETGGPIFSVAIQSGVLLDLEECPVAVLSRTPPDPANGSLTLATYRCSPAPAPPPLFHSTRLNLTFNLDPRSHPDSHPRSHSHSSLLPAQFLVPALISPCERHLLPRPPSTQKSTGHLLLFSFPVTFALYVQVQITCCLCLPQPAAECLQISSIFLCYV